MRVAFEMTLPNAIIAVSDGIPGALTALATAAQFAPEVDPDSALDVFGPVLAVDHLEIYGSAIWVLYKDHCRQDIVSFLGLLRACQLGFIDSAVLRRAAAGADVNLDVAGLLAQVRERLPNFTRADGATLAARRTAE